ncbi:NAD(P)-dependent oxidoreductase [Nocardia sp. CC227C]|uniref:NAD(P)-dependent oxidoreductase n=1 Tax=Nocardia sp. CC227C TaxID=3044562 RepID=UPI00278BE473|nr:NAD(P)-binding domain-containing protein [Nocardia sp. CC227C]
MADNQHTPVTVLGLGAMGSALAAALLKGGRTTTVWNRSAGKATDLVARGATEAASVREAVRAGEVIIAVLLDHASVHEQLDPVVAELRGKQLVNLTSTAPAQSRELARWAAAHGIDFLDGGIMAIPPMIGQPGSALLYSGSQAVFDRHRETLELFGSVEYFGTDAGMAALFDFALLANMYAMFGGFFHAAAMVGSAGVSAEEFGHRAQAWLTAMAHGLPEFGRTIDSGDFRADVQQLAFQKAAVDAIARASRDAGVALDVIAPVRNLIDRQIADGHGALAFEHTITQLR